MRYTVFWRVIKIREIDKLFLNYLKELSNCIRIALRKWFIVKYSTAHRLLMFIVTFCIILNLNQVKSTMIYSHKQHFVDRIFCNRRMLTNDDNNLYSKIQLSPNIFIGKVIHKIHIPNKGENWKMIALVKVMTILRDIYTPHKLRVNSNVWIGPVSDVINQPCISPVKNQSAYIFYGTQLADAKQTFQILFRPVKYSKAYLQIFNETIKRKEQKLIIQNINQKSFSADRKVTITCTVSGYPQPIIYWVKNSQSATSRSIQHKLSSSSSEIIISNVRKSDAGIYNCYAENIYGYTKKEFELNITETPESKSKCRGILFYCLNGGYCNKANHACICKVGYIGRRCQFRDN